jgi:cytochrome c-type biogenesis protein CcmE
LIAYIAERRFEVGLEMDEQDAPRGAFRMRTVVLLLAAVGGFYIFINSAMEGGVYYLTVDEAQAQPPKSKRPIRIKGKVVKGTYQNPGEGKEHSFSIESGSAQTMPVKFSGALPDVFAEEREVIVTGLRDTAGTLVATEVSAKCPSKYEGGMSEEARERLGTN